MLILLLLMCMLLVTGFKEIDVEVTSYCLKGRTYIGVPVSRGVAAVDPRYIPLKSKIYIPGYGWAVALDTGGKIKGKKIDVWLPEKEQAIKWGKRKLKVLILNNVIDEKKAKIWQQKWD